MKYLLYTGYSFSEALVLALIDQKTDTVFFLDSTS